MSLRRVRVQMPQVYAVPAITVHIPDRTWRFSPMSASRPPTHLVSINRKAVRNRSRRYTAGLHIGHDRGAAILCNGELIGHLAQERLDRKKNSMGSTLPYEALDRLLGYLRLDVAQMDAIGLTFENM